MRNVNQTETEKNNRNMCFNLTFHCHRGVIWIKTATKVTGGYAISSIEDEEIFKQVSGYPDVVYGMGSMESIEAKINAMNGYVSGDEGMDFITGMSTLFIRIDCETTLRVLSIKPEAKDIYYRILERDPYAEVWIRMGIYIYELSNPGVVAPTFEDIYKCITTMERIPEDKLFVQARARQISAERYWREIQFAMNAKAKAEGTKFLRYDMDNHTFDEVLALIQELESEGYLKPFVVLFPEVLEKPIPSQDA